jgi:hypothetical protein
MGEVLAKEGKRWSEGVELQKTTAFGLGSPGTNAVESSR